MEECQEARTCRTPIFVQCAQVCLTTSTFCEVKLDVCKGWPGRPLSFQEAALCKRAHPSVEVWVCRLTLQRTILVGQFSPLWPMQQQCPGLHFCPTMWFYRSLGPLCKDQLFRDMSSCSTVSQLLCALPLGEVSDTSSVVSIWFTSSYLPFLAAESSGSLLFYCCCCCWNARFLCVMVTPRSCCPTTLLKQLPLAPGCAS